jgi:phage-related protein
MAEFTWTPSFPATRELTPRVRKFQAGDGYEHRIRFGLNTQAPEWRLSFANRTDEETAEIRTFLDARGGVEAFDWITPNGFTGKWVCDSYQQTLTNCNNNTIEATFRRVFEP